MKLYRPVGPRELELIEATAMRAYPPRLAEQPIFYPVLSFAYAERIARDWNASRADDGYRGFVTNFDLDDVYASLFEAHPAGGRKHLEFWIPAEDLETFNRHIDGPIRVIAAYENGARIH